MYEWILAGHIISIIAWMAGLLYLPRLFVYHAEAEPGSVQSETFKIMERRLLKAIMTPAMIASWGFGGGVTLLGQHFYSTWWLVKLGLVIALSIFHMACGRWVRLFAGDENRHKSRYFRIMNEVPTILMVVIICLVVIKPG